MKWPVKWPDSSDFALAGSLVLVVAATIYPPSIASGGETFGIVHSIDGLSNSESDGSLRASAEYCLRHGQIDKSILFCQQAVKKGESDVDLHAIYAEALERKTKELEGSRKNACAVECVRQWLIVLRSETGEEAGIGFHGIAIPGMGHMYQDEERTMTAKTHLKQIAGRPPHVWETDDKYLKTVFKNEKSVVARIVSR